MMPDVLGRKGRGGTGILGALAAGLGLLALTGCGGAGSGDRAVTEAANRIDRGIQYVRDIPTRVEPPVQVGLRPFTFSPGYYVTVVNTATDRTLTNVVVTYTGTGGTSRSQTVGTLGAGRRVRLDPEAVNWRVEKNEKVRVSADGYLSKTLSTNDLVR